MPNFSAAAPTAAGIEATCSGTPRIIVPSSSVPARARKSEHQRSRYRADTWPRAHGGLLLDLGQLSVLPRQDLRSWWGPAGGVGREGSALIRRSARRAGGRRARRPAAPRAASIQASGPQTNTSRSAMLGTRCRSRPRRRRGSRPEPRSCRPGGRAPRWCAKPPARG